MTLRKKDGNIESFIFETGKPSMGAIYGLMTTLRVGRNWE